jgi:hypothetical protein
MELSVAANSGRGATSGAGELNDATHVPAGPCGHANRVAGLAGAIVTMSTIAYNMCIQELKCFWVLGHCLSHEIADVRLWWWLPEAQRNLQEKGLEDKMNTISTPRSSRVSPTLVTVRPGRGALRCNRSRVSVHALAPPKGITEPPREPVQPAGVLILMCKCIGALANVHAC